MMNDRKLWLYATGFILAVVAIAAAVSWVVEELP